ncbi:MAG: universal stress protein [Proteobacteria bacterium]|nr:universal stress protein [Pseudomonadota bacterium]
MRDILAYASNHQTFTPSLCYAAALAKQFEARLNALYVQEPITYLPTYAAIGLVAEIARFTEEEVEAARQNGARFTRWASDRGVAENDWMVVEGALKPVLAEICNWHDLLVLGVGGDSGWGSVGRVGELLLSCGAPCVVVPERSAIPTSEARLASIAVAWNGSPESVRVIHAALPLLARADRVTLIDGETVDPTANLVRFSPMRIEPYLARHGVKVVRRRLEVGGDEAGAALLAAAHEAQADLLVMGAYGKSRFSEWLLGGATRHVLEYATLPLFMRH